MIAFISDLHLTPERPEATQWFSSFMENSVSQVNAIYILGDLFEYWVGDDASEKIGQQQVESVLKKTSDNGIKIYFMHGNRDFLVGEEFAKRTGVELLTDPAMVRLGNENVLISHGDSFCTDDIEHQQARQYYLNRTWKIEFLKKPIEERITAAFSLRQQSEQGKQVKSIEIMDVNQETIENIMREYRVQKLIHGHTHRPAVHDFDIDGKPARRFVLGDWYTQKSILYFEDGNYALQV